MNTIPLRVDHFALPVFDAAATFRFYTEVLGVPLVDALSGDDWGGKPWLMMIFSFGDGRQIALVALRGVERPAPDGLPDEVCHFAFSVSSEKELQAWQQRLQEHRVDFREEDHGSQRSIYFADPNGIILEITTPASEGTIIAIARMS